MQGRHLERLALQELPGTLASLLDLPPGEEVQLSPANDGPDAVVEAAGRTWVVEVKHNSGPGVVEMAAKQLRSYVERSTGRGVVPLLVVPFMSDAGAEAAARANLNWLDLSGNARLREGELFVWVEGRPNRFPKRGRPSSPFATKSARATRLMLADPWRWWRQADLAKATKLDDGHLSRIVGRLDEDELLDHRDSEFRPRDPNLLLDAWADDYRFDRHDVIVGHMTGSGADLASHLDERLDEAGIDHAFTGLPAAWAISKHARFRLCSVYVTGDPRDAASEIGLRRNETGANVQLIGPDDDGVFDSRRDIDGLPCVSPVQIYLDLLHLPERADEAAQQLRQDKRLWDAHE